MGTLIRCCGSGGFCSLAEYSTKPKRICSSSAESSTRSVLNYGGTGKGLTAGGPGAVQVRGVCQHQQVARLRQRVRNGSNPAVSPTGRSTTSRRNGLINYRLFYGTLDTRHWLQTGRYYVSALTSRAASPFQPSPRTITDRSPRSGDGNAGKVNSTFAPEPVFVLTRARWMRTACWVRSMMGMMGERAKHRIITK